MNKLILTIATLLIPATTYGQGTVNFANRLTGVFDAPVVLLLEQTRGAGEIPGVKAQLLLVNGTSINPVGTAIAFRGTTGALAKYFDGGQVDIPGTSAGGTATLRVRVSGPLGITDSASFSQLLGGGTLPPENMVSLQGFTYGPLPEPSTVALGVLGTAALLAFCKRK
jgi:hypothetical protein